MQTPAVSRSGRGRDRPVFGGRGVGASDIASTARKEHTISKFILSYRSEKTYDWFADPEGLLAWGQFLNQVIAPKVIDVGWPAFEETAIVGEAGATTQVGGYSIVEADDLETVVSMARHCPTVGRGGGVEVAVLADLPPEHPAEQIRLRLASPVA